MFSPDHFNAVFIIASVTRVLAFALLMTKKVITPIDEFSEATSEIKDLADQIKGPERFLSYSRPSWLYKIPMTNTTINSECIGIMQAHTRTMWLIPRLNWTDSLQSKCESRSRQNLPLYNEINNSRK